MLALMMMCEDFELNASDGTQQVSAAARPDACRHSRNSQEVFRPIEITDRER